MEGVRLELSVVIPAYNEAARLPRTIERVERFLAGRLYEIVVVDDGSTDGTVEAARAVAGRDLVVLRNDVNRGKGYAVRRGMLAARAERRLLSDADLSTPIEELGRLESCLDTGFDIAIGSRALAGSRVEIHQPWYRENMGRLFNVCVRALAVPGVRDTQCGFKLFAARAAQAVFAAARVDGFSFDVEALFIARRLGYRIAEVPVVWRNDAATRVGLGGGFRAFPDLLRIRLNGWRGAYEPRRTDDAGARAL
ncbi:MAG TPA: dolichyl-phosphate beta-glucosyltransferase [Vicinamibacteria bacterium]|nr:dolichyl-phosphate beta-glucosyltransferase [Vicinamibacteria bacterium]